MDGCYQNKVVGGKKIGWDVISVVINNNVGIWKEEKKISKRVKPWH
jgi:hypothetical protein